MDARLIRDLMALAPNLGLLVALTALSGSHSNSLRRPPILGAVAQGLLFGLASVLGMLVPLELEPGVFFDGRSVMTSLCALYFGPLSGGVAGLMAIAYRLFRGGPGAPAGVLIVVASMTLGLAARREFQPERDPPGPGKLFALGLLVHAAMLAILLVLPAGAGHRAVDRIGLLVLLLFPLATVLGGAILSNRMWEGLALEALRQSEERFELSMEATGEGLWDWDVERDLTYYSPAYYRVAGYEPGEFPATGDSWRKLIHPDDLERVLGANQACIDGSCESFELEYRIRAKDGDWKWISARGMCASRAPDGRALRLVGAHADITARKQAEEALQVNLAEKEVLLHEVHHRVKNNLNVISSLLSLQSSSIGSPEEAVEAFRNSADRVMAMALVHEEMYRSPDRSGVDMGAWLGHLVSRLAQTHPPSPALRFELDSGGVELGLNESIPCAIVLNELVSNAMKHAFPEGGAGTIRVTMRHLAEERVGLEVSDDGVGLPEGVAPGKSLARGRLGLTLVSLLVDQLDGKIAMETGKGTLYRISFPLRPYT